MQPYIDNPPFTPLTMVTLEMASWPQSLWSPLTNHRPEKSSFQQPLFSIPHEQHLPGIQNSPSTGMHVSCYDSNANLTHSTAALTMDDTALPVPSLRPNKRPTVMRTTTNYTTTSHKDKTTKNITLLFTIPLLQCASVPIT